MTEQSNHHYQGPATIVGADGQELDIDAAFRVEGEPIDLGDGVTAPLRSWRGEGFASSGRWTLDLLGDATLRMPDGRTGRCVVTSAREAGGSVELDIVGSGKPPFGEWD